VEGCFLPLTMTVDAKVTSARAFVRSLNILLKFARLYGFDHARTAAQFSTAWDELRAAMPQDGEAGLLLGTAGDQLLLDGVPMGGSQAERSFAQLLNAAGVASIQFSHGVTQDELSRMIRGFPLPGLKPAEMTSQLKAALTGTTGIRVNEVRFVAEDPSLSGVRAAAQITARTLGVGSEQLKEWLTDPQKLLELIAASEGSHSGSGDSGAEDSTGGFSARSGLMPSGAPRTTSGGSAMQPAGGGGVATEESPSHGFSAAALGVGEQDLVSVLKVLTQLGRQIGDPTATPSTVATVQKQIAEMPAQYQELLRQAISNFSAKSPDMRPSREMLVNLAEHMAIRFALERYDRGEVKVNAVRQTLERMSKEIESLREILGKHEDKMAKAGMQVESHAELLDRQFWASVPESGKCAVLLSTDAWCIPPRNIRTYLNELMQRGDAVLFARVLMYYAACIRSDEAEARRRTAMGMAELADLYANDPKELIAAIQMAGMQMGGERDPDIQSHVNSAFVRLSQEASARHCYPAIQQALTSLDGVENQRPSAAKEIRPRIGAEERLPEFLEEATRSENPAEGLVGVLRLIPQAAMAQITMRFNRSGHRLMNDRLAALAKELGDVATTRLREAVRMGSGSDAAEATGLLSRIDPAAIEEWLPGRIAEWPLAAQDRAVRVLASAGAPRRGEILLALYGSFDPLVRPITLDEMGMCGDTSLGSRLGQLLESEGHDEGTEYVRVKTIEALGRLHDAGAQPLLHKFLEERKAWRWAYHDEVRISALQAIAKVDPEWAASFQQRAGLDQWQLSLVPLDASMDVVWHRQRRYQRLRLREPVSAAITNLAEPARLAVKGLSLSGGTAICERHILPGTHVTLKIALGGMRSIRAQALVRDVRGESLGFEFVSMDLEDRSRLRRFLFSQIRPEGSPSSDIDKRPEKT
jgi:hypothetical protein